MNKLYVKTSCDAEYSIDWKELPRRLQLAIHQDKTLPRQGYTMKTKDLELCCIEDNWAWFTASLEHQKTVNGKPIKTRRIELVKVAFDSYWELKYEGLSEWELVGQNRDNYIEPGCTLGDFIKKIESDLGRVYLDSETRNALEEEPKYYWYADPHNLKGNGFVFKSKDYDGIDHVPFDSFDEARYHALQDLQEELFLIQEDIEKIKDLSKSDCIEVE